MGGLVNGQLELDLAVSWRCRLLKESFVRLGLRFTQAHWP